MSDLHDEFCYRCTCGALTNAIRLLAGRITICQRCDGIVKIPRVEGNLATGVDFELTTPRFTLSLVSPRDWKKLYPIYSDSKNYEYEILEAVTNPRELKKYLREFRFPRKFRKNRQLRFQIVSKETENVVGLISMALDESFLVGAVGFMVDHAMTGQGIGTEAVEEVIRFGFDELYLHRIEASCDSENEACIRLLQKVGLVEHGRIPQWFCHPKRGWIDLVMFGKTNPGEF